MKKSLVLIAAVVLSGMLAGCAALGLGDSPGERLDASVAVYNETLENLIDARAPCVDPLFGPEHESCLISDAAYLKITAVRDVADRCIKDADLALIAGANNDALLFLACAETNVATFARYLLE